MSHQKSLLLPNRPGWFAQLVDCLRLEQSLAFARFPGLEFVPLQFPSKLEATPYLQTEPTSEPETPFPSNH